MISLGDDFRSHVGGRTAEGVNGTGRHRL
jgi:hypothetical protein